VGEDLVYVNDAGTLRALDSATGHERWHATVPGGTSAVVDGGVLVIGTGDGYLLGLDAINGTERWRFQISPNGAAHNPAVSGGIGYAGGDDPGFFAVDTASGELLWRGETGDDQTGTAVVAEGIAYIGGSAESGEGHLYAFAAATGALLWQRDEPIFTPAVFDGVGYSGSVAGIVYSFDTATGSERWRVQLGEVVRPLAVVPGIVYAPSDGDHAIYALDAETGRQLWKIELDGGIDGSIAVDGGVAYVTTTAGSIYAIGGTEQGAVAVGSPVAATPAPAASTPVAASAVEAAFVWETSGGPGGIDTFYVAVAPDGTVWANDAGQGRFQLFDSDGGYLETWAPDGVPPDSALFLAFDPEGNIYVADGRFIHKYGPDRQPLVTWGGEGTADGQFQNTTGIGVDGAGNVYVCDEDRNDVQKFDTNGTFLAKWGGSGSGDGQFGAAGFMDVDPSGNSFVVDHAIPRIEKFDPDGRFLFAIADAGAMELSSPNDVAVDGSGNIFVVQAGRGEVLVFDPAGQFLTSWGSFGTGEGQLLSGDAIALDGTGGVYVADNAAGRIVKFRLNSPMAP
jgi:outer membrane protein assembly factor BamB